MSKQNAEIYFTNKQTLICEDIKDVTVDRNIMTITYKSGNKSVINTSNVNSIYFYSEEDSDVI